MPQSLQSTRRFLVRYERDYPTFQKTALLAEQYVRSVVRDRAIEIHVVTSRAKEPDSVRRKLRRKVYSNPKKQLTDRVGVRVITYYESDVDQVVKKLALAFEIDPTKSEDKRRRLDVREFGYRSVQLAARAKNPGSFHLKFAGLKDLWFEIQVRSILEHAWAEIEHGVVYKSGTKFSKAVKRRFAALAGTLEILESEFLSLKKEREKLIDAYKNRYSSGGNRNVRLDAARLVGFLEYEYPDNPGWRSRASGGSSLPTRSDVDCVDALRAVRIRTGRELQRLLRSSNFKRKLAEYASDQMIQENAVTHFSIIMLAIGLRDKEALNEFFPDIKITA